jgi:hypothetical protein
MIMLTHSLSVARSHNSRSRHRAGNLSYLLPLDIFTPTKDLLEILGFQSPFRRSASHNNQQIQHSTAIGTDRSDNSDALTGYDGLRDGCRDDHDRHAVSRSLFESVFSMKPV